MQLPHSEWVGASGSLSALRRDQGHTQLYVPSKSALFVISILCSYHPSPKQCHLLWCMRHSVTSSPYFNMRNRDQIMRYNAREPINTLLWNIKQFYFLRKRVVWLIAHVLPMLRHSLKEAISNWREELILIFIIASPCLRENSFHLLFQVSFHHFNGRHWVRGKIKLSKGQNPTNRSAQYKHI